MVIKLNMYFIINHVFLAIQGLATICGAGDIKGRHGVAVYIYTCNSSMDNKYVFRSFNYILVMNVSSCIVHLKAMKIGKIIH